ncbi:MAG TPA: RpiB/LacA/LacB family sugar-phosphate isomerase [Candidatus Saccharimonadales bacterium]|nr:RpiB/LacA/LacB family sugar-phosphate isomerase [Candidatus Saccharimonadales bacterium]
MRIALATDHAGFEQVKELRVFLEALGHMCEDFGPIKLDPSDDYPNFIFPAARAVASGQCDAGIILGRSGQGEAMAANRVKKVRCAVFYGTAVAKSSVDASGEFSHDPYEVLKKTRQHNHANMLSLAAVYLTLEDMKRAVKLWLETPYSNEERHLRRIAELDKEV